MRKKEGFIKKAIKGIIVLIFLLGIFIQPVFAEEIVFYEDFEAGWGFWYADNGVWQVGTPSSGPDGAYSGDGAAGTVLDGNYPGDTDSRLISSSIMLPSVSGDEEIHLSFWQWFSYGACDVGYVQISFYDSDTSTWSAWTDPPSGSITNNSPWSLKDVDLTGFAGERVKIAFYHTATTSTYPANCSSSSSGWYIDDIQISKILPAFTGDFEFGWDDWSADRGVWQVGTPSSGPDGAYSGDGAAGTVLDGNYPGNTDSRLISSTIMLPNVNGGEEIHLRFMQWFSFGACDGGSVQISVYDSDTSTWSAWTNVPGSSIANNSPWSLKGVPLTGYAGKKIKIAFYHTATTSTYPANCSSSGSGWYIDDVKIIPYTPPPPLPHCSIDLNDDGVVDIPDVILALRIALGLDPNPCF